MPIACIQFFPMDSAGLPSPHAVRTWNLLLRCNFNFQSTISLSYILLSFFAIMQLAGLVSAGHVVMSRRSTEGSIAWAVALVSLPVLAFPAYLLLGRSRLELLIAERKSSSRQLQRLDEQFRESTRHCRFPEATMLDAGFLLPQALRFLPTRGNKLELLTDGEATFQSIFEGLEAAEKYALVQFYIVRQDSLGQRLADALIACARRGILVCLQYDEIGSRGLGSRYGRRLRAAGVRVSAFGSRANTRSPLQINFRNHRKNVVVDGQHAWIGGHNVGDEYLPTAGPSAWRDTHLKISGPAALDAQRALAGDWHAMTGEILALDWSPQPVPAGDSAVTLLPTGPADPLNRCEITFLHLIAQAKHRLWIETPYFVPGEQLVSALQLASLRGVDVKILIPSEPDHRLAWLASFHYTSLSSLSRVSFHRYRAGFLHSKAMLIDDRIAVVGTVNLDNRSFNINFELTAVSDEPAFVRSLARMIETDLANCDREDPASFDQRSLLFRASVRTARLFSPLL